jgi:hypothetical protein
MDFLTLLALKTKKAVKKSLPSRDGCLKSISRADLIAAS